MTDKTAVESPKKKVFNFWGYNKKALITLAVVSAIGLALSLMRESIIGVVPNKVKDEWNLIIIFTATIICSLLSIYPTPVLIMLSLSTALFTKAIAPNTAFDAYGKASVWLMIFAFFVARAIVKTNLGTRVCYLCISKFAKSTLSLAYTICALEAFLGACIPSNTARGAGIMIPMLSPFLKTDDTLSEAEKKKKNKESQYILLTSCFGNCVSSAMNYNGCSANIACIGAAAKSANQKISYGTWYASTIIPSVIIFLTTPIIMYFLVNYDNYEGVKNLFGKKAKAQTTAKTPLLDSQTLTNDDSTTVVATIAEESGESVKQVSLQEDAKQKLEQMGAMSLEEKKLCGLLALLFGLWIASSYIDSTASVVFVTFLMIITGVLDFKDDIAKEKSALEILLWLPYLLSVSGALEKGVLLKDYTNKFSDFLSIKCGLSPEMVLLALTVVYCFAHYLFASVASLVAALYMPVYIAVKRAYESAIGIDAQAKSLPVPVDNYEAGIFDLSKKIPVRTILVFLAILAPMSGTITPFASGCGPTYFNTGKIKFNVWLRAGFIFMVYGIVIFWFVGFKGYWSSILGNFNVDLIVPKESK